MKICSTFLSKILEARFSRAILFGVLLYAALVNFSLVYFHLNTFELWVDEFYTLLFSSGSNDLINFVTSTNPFIASESLGPVLIPEFSPRSLSQIAYALGYGETHPALYYWFVNIWRSIISDDQWSLRLLSLVFALGLLVFSFLSARIITRSNFWSFIYVMIISSGLHFLYYSTIIRMHMLSLFLASISLFIVIQWNSKASRGVNADWITAIGLGFFLSLTLLNSFVYLIFVLAIFLVVYLKKSTKLSLITFSATGIFYLPYFYLYGSKQLIMLPYLDFVKPGSIITPLLSSLYTPTTLDQSTGNIWKSLFFLSPFPFAEYTIISFLALIIIAASLLLWILRDSFSRLLLLLLSSSLGLVLVIELLFGAEILSWADGRAVNFIYLIFCLTIFYVLYKWRDSAVILASFSIIFWLNSIVVLTHSSENILEQNFKYTDLSVLISTTRNSLYRDNKEKKALIIGQHNIQLRHYQVQAATSFDFEFDYLVLSNDSLYLLEGESDLNLNDYDVILFLNYTSGVMNNIDQAFQLLGQNQQFRLILEGEGGGHWGPLDEFEYFILNRPYTL